MASPGITKNVTVGDAWQRLGAMIDPTYPTELREGSAIADGCYFCVNSYGVQVAFDDAQPNALTFGHVIAVGDSEVWNGQAFIKRAWFKNAAAGSAGILAITPIFSL